MNDDPKLYYERRVKQHRNRGVAVSKIVTIREQIKTFTSMFLDQPHLASGYFSKAYQNNKEMLFIDGHKFSPYYISSLSLYVLNSLIKDGDIENIFKKAKYHLIMIFRIIALNRIDLPKFNSREMDELCDNLRIVLLDRNKALSLFVAATKILVSIEGIDLEDQATLYKANIELLKSKAIESFTR